MTTTAEQVTEPRLGISAETELEVLKQARMVGEALQSPQHHTIALVGGCAMTDHEAELLEENQRIADVAIDGLITLHRIPVWKPRSNPAEDWEGLETNLVDIRNGKGHKIEGTEAQGAVAASRILSRLTSQNPISAIEIAQEKHVDAYGHMLSVGWIGSRKVEDEAHILRLARRDPMTPLLIKNGMNGSIDSALDVAKKAQSVRRTVEGAAPAAIIFRGGEDFRTPESWEETYIQALERTSGKLIVDVAHGSEMAHDPAGKFTKSVEGQVAAMETVIRLAEAGYKPAGIMIEASDLESPTDPVMPLQVALDGVKRFHAAKLRQPVQAKV